MLKVAYGLTTKENKVANQIRTQQNTDSHARNKRQSGRVDLLKVAYGLNKKDR